MNEMISLRLVHFTVREPKIRISKKSRFSQHETDTFGDARHFIIMLMIVKKKTLPSLILVLVS